MHKIISILLVLLLSGNAYCQNPEDNDSIIKALQGRVNYLQNNDSMKIGGGRLFALVVLDNVSYVSDTIESIKGIKSNWIKDIEILKSYKILVLMSDTIRYNFVVYPKKKYYKEIKRNIIEYGIQTAPNNSR
jgi:hypothetical protein